ncbi:MAG: heme-binding domain-containing protein, partial [bacterium]|nr:heme-binding domain-containing protein [bacterium]
EVEEGEMPMFVYLPMHSEAKLTEEEHATLKAWAARYGEHDDD